MIEVEVKARLNEDEINELISKLLDMGFKRIEKKEEVDVYFNGIDRDFSVTDEALRVRKSLKMDTGQVKFYVTYKGPKLDNVSKTREEIEVTVDNGAAIHKIFEKLGFKPVKPIKNLGRYIVKMILKSLLIVWMTLGLMLNLKKLLWMYLKKKMPYKVSWI